MSSTHKRAMMIDTGASCRIVNVQSLNLKERSKMRRLQPSFITTTANGELEVTHEDAVYISELGLEVQALVLEDSPSVLSIGQLKED